MAGDGPAKEPKRRENMDAMVGNWEWEGLGKEGGRRGIYTAEAANEG